MSSKEFSLKWNNFSSNLTSGFLSHLSENDLVDVTLAVEGQLLAVHKLVLSVCSPYFKNIFKENPCQHPVIILKDVKYTEITSLLKFMYQGEVNVKQEDLPNFLKLAQMLQIKGLVGGEEQIIPLLNNYTDMPDMHNSENVTVFDIPNKQNKVDMSSELCNSNKVLDESAHSQRIAKKNTKTRKKHLPEYDYNSSKKLRNESNVNSKDDVCVLIDNDERNANDLNSEKNIRHSETTEAINYVDNEKIIKLTNEQNLEGHSFQQTGTLYIC
ncbi:hypothetical protein PUN28_018710 [Cardiocondyla obscurior]|uniref:BTB domain-containing protein n=1 Tax=Cardiocondyla obscurior TaxID=286306 RepID=A0AAW2EDH7_9HYME